MNIRSFYNRKIQSYIVRLLAVVMLIMAGCQKEIPPSQRETEVKLEGTPQAWSNDFDILMPQLNEDKFYGNEYVQLDTSNSGDGYFYIRYTGDNQKVKLQIFSDTSITYTYNIAPGVDTVIPFNLGSGEYSLTVYENIQDNEYAMVYAEDMDIKLNDELKPFLYPNQYVWFTAESDTTALAKQLTDGCTNELEAVGKVYDYMIKNITYDYDKAANVQPGYLPDVDEILSIKTGICFDYASTMSAMLRSQGVPVKLVIGYTGKEYHAWINVYSKSKGWITGAIYLAADEWKLMDPTFASTGKSSKTVMKYINNKKNYKAKFSY